jgi:dCMP deaminase
MNYEKWDRRFLGLCDHISVWSKDPNMKVGAVLVKGDKSIASTGFNGFPPEHDDDFSNGNDTIHAEDNCLRFNNSKINHRYTLYTSFCPCTECVTKIHKAGISRIVTRRIHTSFNNQEHYDKWKPRFIKSLDKASELDIVIRFI